MSELRGSRSTMAHRFPSVLGLLPSFLLPAVAQVAERAGHAVLAALRVVERASISRSAVKGEGKRMWRTPHPATQAPKKDLFIPFLSFSSILPK